MNEMPTKRMALPIATRVLLVRGLGEYGMGSVRGCVLGERSAGVDERGGGRLEIRGNEGEW